MILLYSTDHKQLDRRTCDPWERGPNKSHYQERSEGTDDISFKVIDDLVRIVVFMP